MSVGKILYGVLFIVSCVALCFEISATRISSVIFVSNYAFIILSLAILCIGLGAIFSFYKIKQSQKYFSQRLSRYLFYLASAQWLFVIVVVVFSVTHPLPYFLLLSLPFFIAGIIYANIFREFSEYGFALYAADLTGAAVGALLPIVLIGSFGATNVVLFLVLLTIVPIPFLLKSTLSIKKQFSLLSIVLILLVALVLNGKREFLGLVPIGKYEEKDFHYVYSGLPVQSYILESRWGIYGRTDLVSYSHQQLVRNIFIDGAAGSPMYKFNGNPSQAERWLLNELLQFTLSVPFLFLEEHEKDSMLIIGPGGGKEVLIALLSNVKHIVGVEVNPDFVNIVKEQEHFNGGIYTRFPNVRMVVEEGRHYVKRARENYDLIVLALPSTEQLQNIDAFAASENFLLTKESLADYLRIVTQEGCLLFSVHNTWELLRLITTAFAVFREQGIEPAEAIRHFVITEGRNVPPTILIKKHAFTEAEIERWKKRLQSLPSNRIWLTYLPYQWKTEEGVATSDALELPVTEVNTFLYNIATGGQSVEQYISNHRYDLRPTTDNSPYFYKVNKGLPSDYQWLLLTTATLGGVIILLFVRRIKSMEKNINSNRKKWIYPLVVFCCSGIGFMIVEISLFQKFVLYLGSPTVSLSILLSSLLVGMGIGSYMSSKLLQKNLRKKLFFIASGIVCYGFVLYLSIVPLFSSLLENSQLVRSVTVFLMMLPFGFILGQVFPTALQIVRQLKLNQFIPWFYGINGVMTVFGSVVAAAGSMVVGFAGCFFAGILFYACIAIISLAKVDRSL